MTKITRISDTTPPATTPLMLPGGRLEVEADVLLPDELGPLGPALPNEVELPNRTRKLFQ